MTSSFDDNNNDDNNDHSNDDNDNDDYNYDNPHIYKQHSLSQTIGENSLSSKFSYYNRSQTATKDNQYKLEDWHSEECKLPPTLTLDLLTSNKMGDQDMSYTIHLPYIQSKCFWSRTLIRIHRHKNLSDWSLGHAQWRI